MATIVCVGLACLDNLFRVAKLPAGGGKFFAEKYVAAPGGPAATAAITVSALGHDAVFLGRLGDDTAGHSLLATLSGTGVDTSHVRLLPGHCSQVSSVVIDHFGERQIINFSSPRLAPDPSWLPADIIASADFLLVDVRWPEGAKKALEIAAAGNVASLIDADLAPVDTSPLIGLASYAVFSEGGLSRYTGTSAIGEGLFRARQKSGCWVAVTAGEQGSFRLTTDGGLVRCPAASVDVVDTCGAGDVYHGALAVALVEQMEIDAAMRFATVAAALKCTTFGGSLGVADRAVVDRYRAATGR
ncbi:MAG: ribokinase [Desulfofustis sp. PB-SRB1]|jgi:sulfofructose kinase|nr:ribokinase [Desulfofustis sp. PB-SRB1]MBM1002650.1 ribokinase [Desulfofustis sp. PB-SRB1]HBH27991.1 ribokinase [Desulfofustis sp.]